MREDTIAMTKRGAQEVAASLTIGETPRMFGSLSRLLPNSASSDAGRLVAARALRGLADGFVAVTLPSYLQGIGFSALQISAIVTGTLLGSAVLVLLVGLLGYRLSRRRLLFACTGLM